MKNLRIFLGICIVLVSFIGTNLGTAFADEKKEEAVKTKEATTETETKDKKKKGNKDEEEPECD